MNAPDADLAALAAELGHQFRDIRLLAEATTHPSAIAGRGRRGAAVNYERLEFLGDRVLGLIVADLLRRRYPSADAGELARRYNALVRQQSLARIAESIGLGRYLRLSPGERASGGAAKAAILADSCEAVLGALYVDGGLAAVEGFLAARLAASLDEFASAAKDAKTALQEWAAANGLPPPSYVATAQQGPAHRPLFQVTVSLPAVGHASGEGNSKRAAEQAAARLLLETLAPGGEDGAAPRDEAAAP